MISPSGCFTYSTVIRRGSDGRWEGRALAAVDGTRHPGLVGDQPQLELLRGLLTLRRSESWFSRKRNRHYAQWGSPASTVRLPVGEVIEAVASEGDHLIARRTGTGDCGVELRRGGELKVGLGAVQGDEWLAVQDDPRAHDSSLSRMAAILDRPDTSLVWVDAADRDHEALVRRIQGVPPGPLVVAIAGQDAEARRRVNHRLSAIRLPPGSSGRWYVDVDERFTSLEEWLSHVHSIPKRRPDDLWIRFTSRSESITLREGEYGFMDPWHLFVQRVFAPGLPGALSQMAIVRAHPGVNQEMVIASARSIASGRIEITP